MAGKTDIANLVVKLTASATDFDKEISGAERRLMGFTNKLASPLNAIRGVGIGITDMIAKPMGGLISDVTRFTALIPGLAGMSTVLAHPIQAATESMERLDKLGKDAKRLGVDAQFLRGLQVHAEDEAGAITPVMTRLLRFQAQLRSGSQDIEEAGGSPASKVAKDLQINVEAWKAANPQELFQLLGQVAQKGAAAGTEFDDLARIAGRGVGGLMNTLRDAEGVNKWTERVQKAGVAMKANIALAEQWDEILKQQKIRSEGKAERMMPIGMAFAESLDLLKTASPMQAGAAAGHGVGNYLRAAFGGEGTLTPKSALDLINQVQEGLRIANDRGGNNTELNKLNDQLNAIITGEYNPANAYMSLSLADRIAEIGAKAKDMISKKPGENLQVMVEKASVLKENLKQVTETSKHMGAVWEQITIDRERQGRSLTESLLTPAEKMRKELEESADLDLTPETRRRLLERTRRALMGAQPAGGPSEAATDLAGSQAWAKRFSASTGQAEQKDDDELKELQRIATLLEETNRKLGRDEKPVPLMAPPGP